MPIPPSRLTERFVRELAFSGKPFLVRDTSIKGFMVAVNKASKSFKVQRDMYEGAPGRRRLVKTVKTTLGRWPDLSVENARTLALEAIAQIKRGINPNSDLKAVDEGPDGWTVEKMYSEYIQDMRVRGCRDRSAADMLERLERYLPSWRLLPITDVKRSFVRDEHRRITANHGPVVANKAMRDFRAAYNLALKIVDDADALAANPVSAVTMNRERASERVILPDELPEWWMRVSQLPNPLRRIMHTLGLFSGLRPGTLVTLERSWIRLEKSAISIPRMKSGRKFDLPLSGFMKELIQDALGLGNVLYPKSTWLFPTRARKSRRVVATRVWKEKSLPSETGHILRHTYRTVAHRLGIDIVDARLLLDHAVPGIDGVYIHESALFDRLIASQQRITEELKGLCCIER